MKSPIATILALIALSTSTHRARAADDAGPAFHHDLDKAAAASKASGKPLIAIFSASWCPPCQQMKRSVYPSKEAQPFHNSFVWAYLDADDRSNVAAMERFGVSGIPHVAFVTSGGQILGHFAGAVAPEDFAKVLTRVLKDAAAVKGAAAGGSSTKR